MSSKQNPTLRLPVDDRRDHVIGAQAAAVTLVEYGDFQCPMCGQAHLVLQALIPQAGDRLRLVYRHFPLTQIHPNAHRAAEASEAAAVQRQFWPYHDML